MEETNAVAVAQTGVAASTINNAEIAAALTQQYKAVQGLRAQTARESVKFGAMLIKWENFLGTNRKNGEGLLPWMEENCPEINYKTAMRYKDCAEKAARLLGGATGLVMAALEGCSEVVNPSGETVMIDETLTTKVDDFFDENKTNAKIQKVFAEAFGTGRRAGRPVGSVTAPKVDTRTSEEKAAEIWASVLAPLKDNAVREYAAYLERDKAQTALSILEVLTGVLKQRLAADVKSL